jgi:hypothetical protein
VLGSAAICEGHSQCSGHSETLLSNQSDVLLVIQVVSIGDKHGYPAEPSDVVPQLLDSCPIDWSMVLLFHHIFFFRAGSTLRSFTGSPTQHLPACGNVSNGHCKNHRTLNMFTLDQLFTYSIILNSSIVKACRASNSKKKAANVVAIVHSNWLWLLNDFYLGVVSAPLNAPPSPSIYHLGTRQGQRYAYLQGDGLLKRLA